jgi:hypothetical protein
VALQGDPQSGGCEADARCGEARRRSANSPTAFSSAKPSTTATVPAGTDDRRGSWVPLGPSVGAPGPGANRAAWPPRRTIRPGGRGQESAESGEQRLVGWVERRAGHRSSQRRDLVTQHHDFDREVASIARSLRFSAQAPGHVQHAQERQVEEDRAMPA